MSRPYIPNSLRPKIAEDARHRCGYCLTAQEFTAMPMHIEHIIPIVAGGQTIENNLWLACPLCNGHKATKTHALDPETNNLILLFNPRTQNWKTHFRWDEDGLQIIGITPIGQATIKALQLNNVHFLRARRRWILAGWHPPK